jgi:hypothetical protein
VSQRPTIGARRGLRGDQVALAVVGLAAFVLGVSVHRDRANLAVALVAFGVLLMLLAAVLPRLQSISGSVAGTEFSLSLLPPTPSVSDRVLVQAPAAGIAPGMGPQDLRGAAAFTSGLAGFGEAIKGGPAAYVVVNLEDGRAWLSSRLYLFVRALAEVRGIETVVFTARSEDTDKFVGVSGVCDVVARLDWAFPWLPQAFGAAWDATRRQEGNRPPRRRLSSHIAEALYDAYVQPPLRQPTAGPHAEEWQQLSAGLWEHANWLDKATIEELMGSALAVEYVIGSRDRDETIDHVMTAMTARWVAIVNQNLEVGSVLDRWHVLDRALKRTTRPVAVSDR